LKLFCSVTNSTWLPMYDFDFWILPYLEGKGVSLDQIKRFVNAGDDLLALELDVARGTSVPDRSLAESRLRQIGAEIEHTSFAAAAAS